MTPLVTTTIIVFAFLTAMTLHIFAGRLTHVTVPVRTLAAGSLAIAVVAGMGAADAPLGLMVAATFGALALTLVGATRVFVEMYQWDRALEGRASTDKTLGDVVLRTEHFEAVRQCLWEAFCAGSSRADDFAESAAELAAAALHADSVSVWVWGEERGTLRRIAGYGVDGVAMSHADLITEREAPGFVRALRSGRPIDATNVEADLRTRDLATSHLRARSVRAMLAAPLMASNGVRGVVCCEVRHTPRRWLPAEASCLSGVAQLIVLALAREENDARTGAARQALQAAHERSRTQSQLLGVLTQALRKTPANQGRTQTTGQAQGGNAALDHLMSRIDDITDLQLGRATLAADDTTLAALADRVRKGHAKMAKARGVELEITHDDGVGTRLSDVARTLELVDALVISAIEGATKGQTVEVTLAADPSAPDDALITVRGGVLVQDVVSAPAAAFALALGGQLSIPSRPGEPAIAILRLPMPAVADIGSTNADARPAGSETPNSQERGLEGLKVLVVEDNPVNRLVLKAMLEPKGADLAYAENGALAVEQTKQQAFDVILMDIHMPVMDGVEAIKVIRADAENLNVATPAYAVTAGALDAQIQEFKLAGFTGYEPKPIDQDKLHAMLRRLLETKTGGRRAA